MPALPPVLPESFCAERGGVWAAPSSVTEWRTVARGRTSRTVSVNRTRHVAPSPAPLDIIAKEMINNDDVM